METLEREEVTDYTHVTCSPISDAGMSRIDSSDKVLNLGRTNEVFLNENLTYSQHSIQYESLNHSLVSASNAAAVTQKCNSDGSLFETLHKEENLTLPLLLSCQCKCCHNRFNRISCNKQSSSNEQFTCQTPLNREDCCTCHLSSSKAQILHSSDFHTESNISNTVAKCDQKLSSDSPDVSHDHNQLVVECLNTDSRVYECPSSFNSDVICNKDAHPENSMSSEFPLCRICYDGENREMLCSPCHCTGSMGMLHASCLELWLASTNTTCCEICNFEYRVERKPKSFSDFIWSSDSAKERCNLICDVSCFVILTPLAAVSSWLCLLGATHYSKWNRRWEVPGLISLTVFLIVIYLCWCMIAFRYHRNLWKEWRRTNQSVHILSEHKIHYKNFNRNTDNLSNHLSPHNDSESARLILGNASCVSPTISNVYSTLETPLSDNYNYLNETSQSKSCALAKISVNSGFRTRTELALPSNTQTQYSPCFHGSHEELLTFKEGIASNRLLSRLSSEHSSHFNTTGHFIYPNSNDQSSQINSNDLSCCLSTNDQFSHPNANERSSLPDSYKQINQSSHPNIKKQFSYPNLYRQFCHSNINKQSKHPNTSDLYSHPNTKEQCNHPSTNKQSSHPNTNKQSNHPDTSDPSSHPNTNEQSSHPNTNEQSSHPNTNEQSSHPNTNEQCSHPNTNEQFSRPNTNEQSSHPNTNEQFSHFNTNMYQRYEVNISENESRDAAMSTGLTYLSYSHIPLHSYSYMFSGSDNLELVSEFCPSAIVASTPLRYLGETPYF